MLRIGGNGSPEKETARAIQNAQSRGEGGSQRLVQNAYAPPGCSAASSTRKYLRHDSKELPLTPQHIAGILFTLALLDGWHGNVMVLYESDICPDYVAGSQNTAGVTVRTGNPLHAWSRSLSSPRVSRAEATRLHIGMDARGLSSPVGARLRLEHLIYISTGVKIMKQTVFFRAIRCARKPRGLIS